MNSGYSEHQLLACNAQSLVFLFTQQNSPKRVNMFRKRHLSVFAKGEETQQIDVTQQIEDTEPTTALIRPCADWFEGHWPVAREHRTPS